MLQKILKEFKTCPPNTKIYLGSDSVRFKKKDGSAWAKISVVAVLHLGGKHGCRVIGKEVIERVYDNNLSKPQYRMMLETYEVCGLYTELKGALPKADIEIHLDINPDEAYGSSCAAKQAAGYVLGVCQIAPILKPNAWAASTCADLFSKKLG